MEKGAWGTKALVLGLGLLAFAALFGLWFYAELRRVSATPITAWTQDHRADCAVVLTGGPHRVREGIDLLAQGQVKKLIISGVHPRASFKEIFPQWPYYSSVSEESVVLERRSGTTYGNAVQSQPLVEALHCRDMILITSNLHMYRAYRTFRGTFPEDFTIQRRATVSGRYRPAFSDLGVETLKSMFYSLFAY